MRLDGEGMFLSCSGGHGSTIHRSVKAERLREDVKLGLRQKGKFEVNNYPQFRQFTSSFSWTISVNWLRDLRISATLIESFRSPRLDDDLWSQLAW